MCCGNTASAHTLAACVLLRLGEPDERGRVRWLGVWWIGVPAPKRVQLIVREASKARAKGRRVSLRQMRRAYAGFDGCGCIEILKRAWERLMPRRRAGG